MRSSRKLALIAACAVILTAFSTPAFASQGASPPTPPSSSASEATDIPTSQTAPMYVVRYDTAVAEANGYKIVTNADGSQDSVPVTDAAKAEAATTLKAKAEFEAAHTSHLVATPYGDAYGNCGQSWINAIKQPGNWVGYQTGYTVFGMVQDSQWDVHAYGFISSNSILLQPGGNSGSWSTEGGIGGVVGPGHAYINVPTSFAILTNGKVCWSGGPESNDYG